MEIIKSLSRTEVFGDKRMGVTNVLIYIYKKTLCLNAMSKAEKLNVNGKVSSTVSSASPWHSQSCLCSLEALADV